MLRRVKVFRGVFVLRGIAATHMSAGETQAQVKPPITGFETLLATARVRFYWLDAIEMSAAVHSSSISDPHVWQLP
jgi:hypothetical protein